MVDIIIPIYNAYEYVKDCFESIQKHTEIPHRIIMINDKSSEQEVSTYLEGLSKKKFKNVIILNNKENLGFVKTVNKGMKYGKTNDVLLLNSDTVVTRNWLKKIKDCAYSNEAIATVTPLTNSATICSVPKFGVDNPLPDNHTADTFGDLIERRSLKLYPQIPTGVGYCMFIKREILDLMGYFDEKHFAKGYGEENDFSMRAEKLGFINVLDDQTFIYHKGSASFTDERKKKVQAKNIKVLNKLHPGYSKKIEKFCIENPLTPIHQNIDFWLKNFTVGKKNILFLKQYEPGPGGVGVHINHLLQNIKGYNFLVLYPTPQSTLKLDIVKEGKVSDTIEFPVINQLDSKKFANREVEKIFRQILNVFDISLVHFQHLLGLSLSLLSIPKEYRIPTALTMHDFFYIDPQCFLYKDRSNEEDPIFYSDVLAYEKGLGKNSIKRSRIQYLKKHIPGIDQLIVPSDFVSSEIRKLYKPKNIKVIEHGTTLKKSKSRIKKKDVLHVAFLGVTAPHKGIFSFLKYAKELNDDINWFCIGDNKSYLDIINNSNYASIFNKTDVTGRYKPEKLPSIFKEKSIDLVVLPALCLESYGFVLSECVQNNIPVLGRDIGTIGDRIKRNDWGWVYKNDDEAIEFLRKFKKSHSLIEEKKEVLLKSKIQPVQTTVKEHEEIYKNLLKKTKRQRIKAGSQCNTMTNRFILERITALSTPEVSNSLTVNSLKHRITSIPVLGPILLQIKKKLLG